MMRVIEKQVRFAAALSFLLLLPSAWAHHSRAEFAGAIEIEGRLVDILWRNPHPGFTIEVDEGGGTTSWTVEGWSSLNGFDRAGITRDRFRIGDTLRIFGLPSERRPGRLLATHVLLPDGAEAVLRREGAPHFNESATFGGADNWREETAAAVVDAAAENRGIFRVWSYPTPNYATEANLPLTDAAAAARIDVDAVNNFVMRCEQKAMPQSMITPNPYEFIDEGDTIRIRGYEGDVERLVHMTDPPDESVVPISRQGLSVGQWQDERTLIIRTSRIDSAIPSEGGVLLTADAEVVERYTLSEDQSRLDYHISVTDPDVFTEPATFEYYWLALGEEFGSYDCGTH